MRIISVTTVDDKGNKRSLLLNTRYLVCISLIADKRWDEFQWDSPPPDAQSFVEFMAGQYRNSYFITESQQDIMGMLENVP